MATYPIIWVSDNNIWGLLKDDWNKFDDLDEVRNHLVKLGVDIPDGCFEEENLSEELMIKWRLLGQPITSPAERRSERVTHPKDDVTPISKEDNSI